MMGFLLVTSHEKLHDVKLALKTFVSSLMRRNHELAQSRQYRKLTMLFL